MLFVVDGTGVEEGDLYKKHMTGGMCDSLAKQYRGKYYRGPVLSGSDTFDIADTVLKDIRANKALGRQPLFLAGHSRGGAIVIDVAKRLQKDGLEVKAMFLFDAVDRTLSLRSCDYISRNVKKVFHARRTGHIDNYFEIGAKAAQQAFFQCMQTNRNDPRKCLPLRKEALKYQSLNDAMKLRMRASNGFFGVGGASIDFGNCGLGHESPKPGDKRQCEYVQEFFLGSHGAIGGSAIGNQDGAWHTPSDRLRYDMIINSDLAAISSVGAWMKKHYAATALAAHDGFSPTKSLPAGRMYA